MKLVVLRKNDEYMEMLYKLREETEELKEEIELHFRKNINNKENIAAEALDVIQVCIGILDKLEREGINIEKTIAKHNVKLLGRGWEVKKIVHINVKEDMNKNNAY